MGKALSGELLYADRSTDTLCFAKFSRYRSHDNSALFEQLREKNLSDSVIALVYTI